MTKKQLMFLSLFVLASFGSYDIYQMKFSQKEPNKELKSAQEGTDNKILNEKEEIQEDMEVVREEPEVELFLDIEPLENEDEDTKYDKGSLDAIISSKELELTGEEVVEDMSEELESGDSSEDKDFEVEFDLLEIEPTEDNSNISDLHDTPIYNDDEIEEKENLDVQPQENMPKQNQVVEKDEVKLSARDTSRLEFYEKKVMDLRTVSENLREKLVNQELSTNNLNSKIRLSREKEKILLSEIESLKGDIEDLKESKLREIKEVEKSVEGYTSQLEKNNKEIAFLNTKQVELKSVIREKEDLIVSLNKNIDNKYEEVKEMQNKVNKTVVGTEEETEQAQFLEIKLGKTQAKVEALKAEILDLESELRDVRFSKNETNEKIKEYSLRNNEIEKILLGKEKEIVAKESNIRYLKRKVKKTLEEKELKRRELVKIIVKNRKDLEDTKKSNHRKSREIKGLMKKITELTEVLNMTKEKREGLKVELKESHKRQEELLDLIKEKEDNNKSLLRELSAVQKKNLGLERDVENLKKTKLTIQFNQELKLNELKSKMKQMEEEYRDKVVERKYNTVDIVDISTVNKDTQTYEKEIEKISKSKNDKLLEQLAKNPRMSPDILKRLSGSKSFYVRNEVAKNPNITLEIGKMLSRDSVEVIRMSLIDNKSLPKEVLLELINDPVKRVREYAKYKFGKVRQ